MTRRRCLRPALALLLAATLSACGEVDTAEGFEEMGERVASISLPTAASVGSPSTSSSARPPSPLVVEVMDPHALWDARDAAQGPGQARDDRTVSVPPELRDAPRPHAKDLTSAGEGVLAVVSTLSEEGSGQIVQLGAYSSEARALAAWEKLRQGPSGAILAGLSPVLEPVEIGNRRLVRLKSRAPAERVNDLCLAADVEERWCRRRS